jgi:hypothetical protein
MGEHPEGEMKVGREDHQKPQSPVLKDGVVYNCVRGLKRVK